MKLTYRADIDGLRTVAVLPVIFYHLGVSFFDGGYVGVDIFFVISGFLITSVILREVELNEFSIARFYERRIRRIFPALFVLLAFTVGAAAILFDAENFLAFGDSVFATTFFFSNILFWNESGYFAKPAELMPLLHTWSLAVEEQFYIFFPLLVVFVARFFKQKLALVFILLAVFSFMASVVVIGSSASSVFYLAPYRMWELLIGSILALNLIPPIRNRNWREGLGLLGLGLILFSVVFYSKETLFPGASALLPTLGAGLIIYVGGGGKSWVSDILCMRPMVFIGQISYSLYLWHWPLIVFGKYYLIKEFTAGQIAIVLLLTFICAILSWQFVEKPFRSKTFLTQKQIFLFGAGLMVTMTFAAALVYFGNGFPQRYSVALMNTDEDVEWQAWTACNWENVSASNTFCTIGSESDGKTFMVWGDSHAKALASGIHLAAGQQEQSGYLAINPGCAPLLGMNRIDLSDQKDCTAYNDSVLAFVESHPELDTIILAARWTVSANGTKLENEAVATTQLVDVLSPENNGLASQDLFAIGLDRTVTSLLKLNRNVILVGQVPEIGYNVPEAHFIAARTGRDVNRLIGLQKTDYALRTRYVSEVFENLLRQYPQLQVIDPAGVLCDLEICIVAANNTPLYRDDDHLSTYGSRYLYGLFVSVFENSPR